MCVQMNAAIHMSVMSGKATHAIVCLCFICVMGTANAEREVMNTFKQIFTQTQPPVLYNLNHCRSIVEGLAGSRMPDVSTSHIVKLHSSTTLASNLGASHCVVNYVYLDVGVNWKVTTEYDRFATLTESGYLTNQGMWENVSKGLTRNQQIAIISCEEGLESDSTPVMPADTNLSFIFDVAMDLSLSVLQCHPGFCVVQITSPTCLKPWISKDFSAIPATMTNRIKGMQKKVSMGSIGIHNLIMSIDAAFENTTKRETAVKMGLNTSRLSGYFVTTCINTRNSACTAEEAHYYGLKLMTTLKMTLSIGDAFVEFVGVTNHGIDPARFLVHHNSYQYMSEADDTLKAYMKEFRVCPKFTMSTGDDRFFYEDNVVYEIGCIACPINTYYADLRIPPTVTESTKNMFVHGFNSGFSRDGTKTTYYSISSEEFPVDKMQRLYSEVVIAIGTTLILQVAGATSTLVIDRVECEDKAVPYVRIDSTRISLNVEMQYSGKLIVVYINDPNLRGGDNSNYEWKTTQVFIMPKHSELIGTCIQCPPRTFSGEYAASDISVCVPTKQHTSAARRLLSMDEEPQNTMSAASWMEIHGRTLIVLGIADDAMYPESDFSIEVYLQHDNRTFVQENVALIAEKVIEIYNVNNFTMEYSVTGMRLHATNMSVIFNIHGMYTNAMVPAQNEAVLVHDKLTHTTTPTQSPSPSKHPNIHVRTPKQSEPFSVLGINAWILILPILLLILIIWGIILSAIKCQTQHRQLEEPSNNISPVHISQGAYYMVCPNGTPV